MANPRKFSEKIALHNQKQAEETAAFEQIMKEVSSVARAHYQKSHHLQLQSLGAYRGGSLPNVNQIGSNATIDLQNALQGLEDMKSGRASLIDRMPRRVTAHRRADASPYGHYLSPPPDTNWRRTNSDSALHTSAMNPNNTDAFHGSSAGATLHPNHRRGDMLDGSPAGDRNFPKALWDPKKVHLLQSSQSRPRSCEVPGINIYPSDQDSGAHIPISNNTGSLPDLTNLHFPSPLATPLDAEDQTSNSLANTANTAHHLGVAPQQSQTTSTSPPQQHSPQSQRRRHPPTPPSPLSLTNQRRRPIPQGATVETEPRLPQYPIYQQQTQGQVQQVQQQAQHPSHNLTIEISQHGNSYGQNVNGVSALNLQGGLNQYRETCNATSCSTSCSSPTSPVSNPNYSPSQSPSTTSAPVSIGNSPFSDAYYLQQQQTNALQHQFEQFTMMPDMPTSSSHNTTAVAVSLPYQHNDMMYGTQVTTTFPSQQLQHQPQPHKQHHQQHHHQKQQQQQHSHNSGIPDIIFTGAGESPPRQDFAKDISNAMVGMAVGFDTDPLFPEEEALKVGLGPLDLDGLQLLSDNDVITDPATEDSFRLDRL
ncbi:CREB-regulated transcription coactivator 1-like isoform X2 [Glandiceps talaboti]